MSRHMSCSLTVDAVRERRKKVTRRHVDTWRTLKAGDRLTLVEKAMGLPKGAQQVVLAEVEIVNARLEPLWLGMTLAEIVTEGFDPDTFAPCNPATEAQVTAAWCQWWAATHGYDIARWTEIMCRRIEWRYLNG